MTILPDSFYEWLSNLSKLESIIFLASIIIFLVVVGIIMNKLDKKN